MGELCMRAITHGTASGDTSHALPIRNHREPRWMTITFEPRRPDSEEGAPLSSDCCCIFCFRAALRAHSVCDSFLRYDAPICFGLGLARRWPVCQTYGLQAAEEHRRTEGGRASTCTASQCHPSSRSVSRAASLASKICRVSLKMHYGKSSRLYRGLPYPSNTQSGIYYSSVCTLQGWLSLT